ncbi:rCG37819 [Rattus norvegicus]|uniref:RCG37819 n=1 Tax=Rattus norvegicus TaxID=10116 RepID=A6K642_RAT|nr:rCG37819 [Rattus norvegicus]
MQELQVFMNPLCFRKEEKPCRSPVVRLRKAEGSC